MVKTISETCDDGRDPAPLAAALDDRITIHDRSDNRLPFSRGIMATSLLATGVPTEDAYRLASIIQQRLLAARQSDFTAEELVAAVHSILASEADESGLADRWTSWRRAKRSGRPVVIVLCGAPGTGKSTLATRIAVRLAITRVVTSDAIRDVLRTVVPEAVLPELHRSTFDLVVPDSLEPFSGFDRQGNAVGSAAVAIADRLADEHRSLILEGVHMLPGATASSLADHPADPIVVERLILQDDADRHADLLRKRQVTEPLRHGSRHLDGFERIRSIQDHLIDVANRSEVEVVDSGEAGNLTQNIVEEIVRRLDHP